MSNEGYLQTKLSEMNDKIIVLNKNLEEKEQQIKKISDKLVGMLEVLEEKDISRKKFLGEVLEVAKNRIKEQNEIIKETYSENIRKGIFLLEEHIITFICDKIASDLVLLKTLIEIGILPAEKYAEMHQKYYNSLRNLQIEKFKEKKVEKMIKKSISSFGINDINVLINKIKNIEQDAN